VAVVGEKVKKVAACVDRMTLIRHKKLMGALVRLVSFNYAWLCALSYWLPDHRL